MKRTLSYRKVVKLIGKPEKCAICGYVFPEALKRPMTSTHSIPHQPTIGHIIPRSKGGGDEASNLEWECHSCNQKMGNGDR